MNCSGGLTVRVQPGLQIVEAMFRCVTAGLIAPGVIRGLGWGCRNQQRRQRAQTTNGNGIPEGIGLHLVGVHPAIYASNFISTREV